MLRRERERERVRVKYEKENKKNSLIRGGPAQRLLAPSGCKSYQQLVCILPSPIHQMPKRMRSAFSSLTLNTTNPPVMTHSFIHLGATKLLRNTYCIFATISWLVSFSLYYFYSFFLISLFVASNRILFPFLSTTSFPHIPRTWPLSQSSINQTILHK